MTVLPFVTDDGGRAAAGYKGSTGDCVTRAIAIATGLPYEQVYRDLFDRAAAYAIGRRSKAARHITRTGATPRNGVHREVYEPYLFDLGWVWVPTMSIGSGTTVHLDHGFAEHHRCIVRLSKHLAAIVDGTVRDTHDPSRDGTRCVYGYYEPGAEAVLR